MILSEMASLHSPYMPLSFEKYIVVVPKIQYCVAENICFGSGSTEPQIWIAAPALAPFYFCDTLKITFSDLKVLSSEMDEAFIKEVSRRFF